MSKGEDVETKVRRDYRMPRLSNNLANWRSYAAGAVRLISIEGKLCSDVQYHMHVTTEFPFYRYALFISHLFGYLVICLNIRNESAQKKTVDIKISWATLVTT